MPQHGARTFDGSIQRGHPGEKDREFETGFPNTDHLCDVRAFARAVHPPDFPIERLANAQGKRGRSSYVANCLFLYPRLQLHPY